MILNSMQLKLIHKTFLDQSVIFYKLKLLLEFLWKAIKGSKYHDGFIFRGLHLYSHSK